MRFAGSLILSASLLGNWAGLENKTRDGIDVYDVFTHSDATGWIADRAASAATAWA